jgi:branched-chain amino acid transport system ATP-binding protein
MAERRQAPGRYLSGGEQQMLAVARALIQNPELIFMDEPSEGLSPKIVGEVRAVIERLSGEGCSILMVEQNLAFALRVGHKLLVMNKGRIVYRGDRAALAADPSAYRQYLGVASTSH